MPDVADVTIGNKVYSVEIPEGTQDVNGYVAGFIQHIKAQTPSAAQRDKQSGAPMPMVSGNIGRAPSTIAPVSPFANVVTDEATKKTVTKQDLSKSFSQGFGKIGGVDMVPELRGPQKTVQPPSRAIPSTNAKPTQQVDLKKMLREAQEAKRRGDQQKLQQIADEAAASMQGDPMQGSDEYTNAIVGKTRGQLGAEQKIADARNPLKQMVKVTGLDILSKGPGALLRGGTKAGLGIATGLDPNLMATPGYKAAEHAAELGGYFIPGAGQAAFVGDTASPFVDSLWHGTPAPAIEAAKGFMRSLNPLEPGVPAEERAMRLLNVAGLVMGGLHMKSAADLKVLDSRLKAVGMQDAMARRDVIRQVKESGSPAQINRVLQDYARKPNMNPEIWQEVLQGAAERNPVAVGTPFTPEYKINPKKAIQDLNDAYHNGTIKRGDWIARRKIVNDIQAGILAGVEHDPEAVIQQWERVTQDFTPLRSMEVKGGRKPTNAVQEQTASQGVLREGQPEVGLSGMATRDQNVVQAPIQNQIQSQAKQIISSPELLGSVKRSVIPALNDRQVLEPIIRTIPVDVMDDFIGEQGSLQKILRNPSVLTHRLLSDPDSTVSRSIMKNAIALMRTGKTPLSEVARGDIELLSTHFALSDFPKATTRTGLHGATNGAELSSTALREEPNAAKGTVSESLSPHKGIVPEVGQGNAQPEGSTAGSSTESTASQSAVAQEGQVTEPHLSPETEVTPFTIAQRKAENNAALQRAWEEVKKRNLGAPMMSDLGPQTAARAIGTFADAFRTLAPHVVERFRILSDEVRLAGGTPADAIVKTAESLRENGIDLSDADVKKILLRTYTSDRSVPRISPFELDNFFDLPARISPNGIGATRSTIALLENSLGYGIEDTSHRRDIGELFNVATQSGNWRRDSQVLVRRLLNAPNLDMIGVSPMQNARLVLLHSEAYARLTDLDRQIAQAVAKGEDVSDLMQQRTLAEDTYISLADANLRAGSSWSRVGHTKQYAPLVNGMLPETVYQGLLKDAEANGVKVDEPRMWATANKVAALNKQAFDTLRDAEARAYVEAEEKLAKIAKRLKVETKLATDRTGWFGDVVEKIRATDPQAFDAAWDAIKGHGGQLNSLADLPGALKAIGTIAKQAMQAGITGISDLTKILLRLDPTLTPTNVSQVIKEASDEVMLHQDAHELAVSIIVEGKRNVADIAEELFNQIPGLQMDDAVRIIRNASKDASEYFKVKKNTKPGGRTFSVNPQRTETEIRPLTDIEQGVLEVVKKREKDAASARSNVAAANTRVSNKTSDYILNYLKESGAHLDFDKLADDALREHYRNVTGFGNKAKRLVDGLELAPGSAARSAILQRAKDILDEGARKGWSDAEMTDQFIADPMVQRAKAILKEKVAQEMRKSPEAQVRLMGMEMKAGEAVKKRGMTLAREDIRNLLQELSNQGSHDPETNLKLVQNALDDAGASYSKPDLANVVGDLYQNVSVNSKTGNVQFAKVSPVVLGSRELSKAQIEAQLLRRSARELQDKATRQVSLMFDPVRNTVTGVEELNNLLRSVANTADVSAFGRQNAFRLVGNFWSPTTWTDFAKSVKLSKDPVAAHQYMRQWSQSETGQNALNSGLHINQWDHTLEHGEEAYVSRLLRSFDEKDFGPWGLNVKSATVKPIQAITQFSNVNYAMQLNLSRMTAWDAMSKAIGGVAATDFDRKAIAKAINAMTGYGNLTQLGDSGAKAVKVAGMIFNAPRWWASRAELLGGGATAGATFGPSSIRAKAAIMKEYVKWAAGVTAFATLAEQSGAQVEKDPRSSKFMQLRWQNFMGTGKPLSVDILGGMGAMTRAVSQIATGQRKQTSGNIQWLSPNEGIQDTMLGAADKMGWRGAMAPRNMTSQDDASDVVKGFLLNRIAPLARAVAPAVGIELGAKDLSPAERAWGLILPINYSQFMQDASRNGVNPALAAATANLFGFSANIDDPTGLDLPPDVQDAIFRYYLAEPKRVYPGDGTPQRLVKAYTPVNASLNVPAQLDERRKVGAWVDASKAVTDKVRTILGAMKAKGVKPDKWTPDQVLQFSAQVRAVLDQVEKRHFTQKDKAKSALEANKEANRRLGIGP